MAALSFAVMLGGKAAAEPTTLTSNTQVFLDATLVDNATGQDVELIGLLHVQTKANPFAGTIGVHANIREAAFLAYATSNPAPNNPLLDQLDALKERIRVLKDQVVDLQEQISDLQMELQQVLATDTNPFLPGIQIDEERKQALSKRLSQLQAEMKRLQQEMSEIAGEMKALLEELKEQADDAVDVYTAAGADAVGASPCSYFDIVCTRIVGFELIHPDGNTSSFAVRLNLLFSHDAKLLWGQAELGCGCDPGEDVCFCP